MGGIVIKKNILQNYNRHKWVVHQLKLILIKNASIY
jgi:hypothetical protein